MHNAYIRPGGVWYSGQVVYHGEFEALDAAQFAAISGDNGGNWAPATPINIGGAGVTLKLVGNNTVSSGYLVVDGSSNLELQAGSVSTIYGSTTFRETSNTYIYGGASWTFDAGTTINTAGALNVSGNATFQAGSFTNFLATVVFGVASSAGFLGTASFGGDVTFYSGTVHHNGPVNFANSVGLNGTFTDVGGVLRLFNGGQLHGAVVASTTGRVVKRYTYIATTGSDSGAYGPATTDRVIVNALTTDVDFTINNTGAVDGDEMVFVNKSNTHFLNILDPSVGLVLALKNAAGYDKSCTVYYHAGEWQILINNRL